MKLSLIILTLLILDANGVNIPDYCWIFFGCSVAVNTFFNWLDIKYFNPRLPRGRRQMTALLLDSVYMRLSQNSQPNSDTPDMNSRKER